MKDLIALIVFFMFFIIVGVISGAMSIAGVLLTMVVGVLLGTAHIIHNNMQDNVN